MGPAFGRPEDRLRPGSVSAMDPGLLRCDGMMRRTATGRSAFSHLFGLRVLQFHRSRPPKDRHSDLDPRLLFIHVLDEAVERGEGSVAYTHLLADLKGDRGLRPLDPLLNLVHNPRRLVVADRRRSGAAAAKKPGDLGRILNQMPGRVV